MGNRGYTVSQYIIESTELCNYECSVILECVPSLRPDILSKSFNKMYEDVNLSDYMNNVKIFCERDVFLIEDFLDFYSEDIIEEIYNSYEWKELTIHGSKVHRYVDVQGVHDSNGHIPIYRNPGDQYIAARYPDRLVMKMIETLNCTLPTLPTFNHAYLKFYTQSKNGINAHTDKTLDLNNNSYIANLSFGYTKSMTFTNKITHEKVIVQMKSNSCLLIGMKTNRK